MSILKSILFYLAIGIDIIAILVAAGFLISDAIRQSSSSNGLLLLLTLAMCGWVALCWYLRLQQHGGIATILAWIPAFPLLMYGIFILMFILFKPDMR